MKELALLGLFLTSVYGDCICGESVGCKYNATTMTDTIELDANVAFSANCLSFEGDDCKQKPVHIIYNGTSLPDSLFHCGAKVQIISFIAPNVQTIPIMSFFNLHSLTTAKFPSAETIEPIAFSGCIALINTEFSKVKSIENGAFTNCNQLRTANFPNATNIGPNAFNTCGELRTANFPSATIILDTAFTLCKNLNSVFLSASPLTISELAFKNCTSLKTIAIPENTTIETNAFQNCGCDNATYKSDTVLCDCKPSVANTQEELLECTLTKAVDTDSGTSTDMIIGIVCGVLGFLLLIGMAFMISTRQSKSTNSELLLGI